MLKLILTLLLTAATIPGFGKAEEAEPAPPPAEEDAMAESAADPVTCYWRFGFPSPDFRPKGGDVFRIAVSGDDLSALSFSYTRREDYRGDARIVVHTRGTPQNTLLIDGQNPGLFSAQTGEFILSLVVPSGWPLYLAEYTDDPYADLVILSNIVELP